MLSFLDKSILFFCAIAFALVGATVFMLYLAAREPLPGLTGALAATFAVTVLVPGLVAFATRRFAGREHPLLPWIAFYLVCTAIAGVFAAILLN